MPSEQMTTLGSVVQQSGARIVNAAQRWVPGFVALVVLVTLAGCGDDDDDGAVDAAIDGGADGGAIDATAVDVALDARTVCPRTPAPADRTRKVVVSHPFTAQAGGKEGK